MDRLTKGRLLGAIIKRDITPLVNDDGVKELVANLLRDHLDDRGEISDEEWKALAGMVLRKCSDKKIFNAMSSVFLDAFGLDISCD